VNEALTIEQAAERYEITVYGIYSLIRAGKLIAHKQGGKTLLPLAALESVFYAVCPVCGKGFKKGNQRQRFCGQSCRQKANRSSRNPRTP